LLLGKFFRSGQSWSLPVEWGHNTGTPQPYWQILDWHEKNTRNKTIDYTVTSAVTKKQGFITLTPGQWLKHRREHSLQTKQKKMLFVQVQLSEVLGVTL
jgi:hypothetical protein